MLIKKHHPPIMEGDSFDLKPFESVQKPNILIYTGHGLLDRLLNESLAYVFSVLYLCLITL